MRKNWQNEQDLQSLFVSIRQQRIHSFIRLHLKERFEINYILIEIVEFMKSYKAKRCFQLKTWAVIKIEFFVINCQTMNYCTRINANFIEKMKIS